MTLSYKQKAIACMAGIILVLAATLYLVFIDVLNWGALVCAGFIITPMAKYIWYVYLYEKRNPVRLLTNALPKSGFSVESVDWNEQKTLVRFTGNFRGDSFYIDASPNGAYIDIIDLPWLQINAHDPSVSRLMESINSVNGQRVGPKVVLSNPGEEGVRHIMTVHTTFLPDYNVPAFISATLIDMLNRKSALHNDLQLEKPWLNKPQSPIGFNASK